MDECRNPATIWGSLVENIALCFKQCQRIRKSLWFKQEDKQRTNHTAKDFEINLYTYPTSAGFCRSTLWMVYVRMFIIKRDQVPQPSPWHGHPKTRDRRKYDHYHQDLRKLARLQPVIFQMEMEQRVFSTWSNVNCAMPRTFQAGRWSYRAELSRKQKTESLQRTDGMTSG